MRAPATAKGAVPVYLIIIIALFIISAKFYTGF